MRIGALATAALWACLVGPALAEDAKRADPLSCSGTAKAWTRTELYFGAGGPRHAKAWRRFLADVVTPRFPDGFTVLDGSGQWRGPHGLEREATHVLIILHPPAPDKDTAIEAIRAAYKTRFRQQSVLRADSAACVKF